MHGRSPVVEQELRAKCEQAMFEANMSVAQRDRGQGIINRAIELIRA